MCDLTSTLFFVGCSAVDCSFYCSEVSWVLNLPQSPETEYTYFDMPQKSLRVLQLNCICYGCKGTKQLLHPLYWIVYLDKCGPICSTGDYLWSKTLCTIQRSICNHGQIISGCDTTNVLPSPYLWHGKLCVEGSTICCLAMTQQHSKDLR